MKRILRYILFATAVCALLGGCSGRAARQEPERAQTLDEYMAEYNAKRAELDKGPTVVAAVERVAELMEKVSLSMKAHEGHSELLKHVSFATDDFRGLTLAQVKPGEHKPPEVFRKEVTASVSEAALAELRKARELPTGLIPLGSQGSFSAGYPFYSKTRSVARLLSYRGVLHLSDGESAAARERVTDMLTVERTLADSPSPLAQLTRCAVGSMTNANALMTALSGVWKAEKLDEMAATLEASGRRPVDVLRRALPLERAFWEAEARRLESMSDKELANVIEATHKSLETFGEFMKHEKLAKPAVAEMRRWLVKERTALPARFGAIKRALRRPGTRIPRAVPGSEASGTPVLRAIYQRFDIGVWASTQTALTELYARRRAAVALIRVLAFRKRNGRLPRMGELRMPEDPFQPGKRMTYVHDRKNGQIGVYAMMWANAFGNKAKEQKTGYRLVLRQGETGR